MLTFEGDEEDTTIHILNSLENHLKLRSTLTLLIKHTVDMLSTFPFPNLIIFWECLHQSIFQFDHKKITINHDAIRSLD